MNEEYQLIKITPDLPKVAFDDIKDWRSKNQFNTVFFRIIEQSPITTCKNCGDTGFILVSFSRAGPFQDVPNHRTGETLMWFDGNEQYGKGWYIITNTISYKCHHCEASRIRAEKGKSKVDPGIVQERMQELIDEKASESYLHE